MRHPQGSGSVGMPFFISLYVVSFLLLKKKKSIDNHQIINAFYGVGATGFEPATSRPPDVYSNRTELRPELCGCKSTPYF